MKLLKILLCVCGAIAALTVFGRIRQKVAANSEGKSKAAASASVSTKDPGLSPQGFFLLKRDEAGKSQVTIFIPENCPSNESERARLLMAGVQAAGIPCETQQGIDVTFNDPDEFARLQKYGSTIENPLVLVKGWAKGNPSADQIIAQYRAN